MTHRSTEIIMGQKQNLIFKCRVPPRCVMKRYALMRTCKETAEGPNIYDSTRTARLSQIQELYTAFSKTSCVQRAADIEIKTTTKNNN